MTQQSLIQQKDSCSYVRPAVYGLAILGALILGVTLFGGFEPSAIAGR